MQPQQKTLTNDTSAQVALSVECNPCLGSESTLESVVSENSVAVGVQTDLCSFSSLATCATQTDSVSSHTTVQNNTSSTQTQTVSVSANKCMQTKEPLLSSPACTKCSLQVPSLVGTNSSAVLKSRSGLSDRSTQTSVSDSQAGGNKHMGLGIGPLHAQHDAQQQKGNAICSGRNTARLSGCAPSSVPTAVHCSCCGNQDPSTHKGMPPSVPWPRENDSYKRKQKHRTPDSPRNTHTPSTTQGRGEESGTAK